LRGGTPNKKSCSPKVTPPNLSGWLRTGFAPNCKHFSAPLHNFKQQTCVQLYTGSLKVFDCTNVSRATIVF